MLISSVLLAHKMQLCSVPDQLHFCLGLPLCSNDILMSDETECTLILTNLL